jgi:hypothetical protein
LVEKNHSEKLAFYEIANQTQISHIELQFGTIVRSEVSPFMIHMLISPLKLINQQRRQSNSTQFSPVYHYITSE